MLDWGLVTGSFFIEVCNKAQIKYQMCCFNSPLHVYVNCVCYSSFKVRRRYVPLMSSALKIKLAKEIGFLFLISACWFLKVECFFSSADNVTFFIILKVEREIKRILLEECGFICDFGPCHCLTGVGWSRKWTMPQALHLPLGGRAWRLLDPLWATAPHRLIWQHGCDHWCGDRWVAPLLALNETLNLFSGLY